MRRIGFGSWDGGAAPGPDDADGAALPDDVDVHALLAAAGLGVKRSPFVAGEVLGDRRLFDAASPEPPAEWALLFPGAGAVVLGPVLAAQGDALVSAIKDGGLLLAAAQRPVDGAAPGIVWQALALDGGLRMVPPAWRLRLMQGFDAFLVAWEVEHADAARPLRDWRDAHRLPAAAHRPDGAAAPAPAPAPDGPAPDAGV